MLRCSIPNLAPYRQLLASPGMRASFVASLLGRLPIGMTGLAILLLVQDATASFAHGGTATATYVVGLAAIAPGVGRLIDRHGPTLVLAVCALVFPLMLLALVYFASASGSEFWVLALALCAGGSFPPLTPCMRTYIRRSLGEGPQVSTAYSLDSVLIELIFIVGPLLVALCVAVTSAAVAVILSATCALAGTLLFLRSPAILTWSTGAAKPAVGLLGPLRSPRFRVLLLLVLCYSIAFGMSEIGVTAQATQMGSPALAGLLLGLMSAGSACGGLAYGSRGWHFPLSRQFAVMLGVMGVGLAILALDWNPWAFGVACVVAGIAMAPALIVQSMLVAKSTPSEQLTEAFTWSASALLGGIGAGFALGGWLLEHHPARAAFLAGAMSATVAALAAWVMLEER